MKPSYCPQSYRDHPIPITNPTMLEDINRAANEVCSYCNTRWTCTIYQNRFNCAGKPLLECSVVKRNMGVWEDEQHRTWQQGRYSIHNPARCLQKQTKWICRTYYNLIKYRTAPTHLVVLGKRTIDGARDSLWGMPGAWWDEMKILKLSKSGVLKIHLDDTDSYEATYDNGVDVWICEK